MKFSTYFVLSWVLMISTVYYAFYTQRKFYPTIEFLVQSKVSLIVAGNMVLASALVVARMVKSLYFGNLREAEVEILVEKAKYAVIETCLALTIFRNEVNTQILVLFGTLIFVKLLHKLSKARLEYLEQIAPVPRMMTIRMGFLLASLLLMDVVGVYFSVNNVMKKGRSVIILFGFEFGLLLNYSLNLAVKFVIQTVDASMENGLQSRGLAVMVVDLICEVIKVITYVAFFCLIFVYYGLPFHLIRDVYSAYFSFQRKFFGFVKYLQLVRNLDSRFPDATTEELGEAGDCLVCREGMEHGKKLPCGHIFHLECLKSWLQHQQSCPLCRAEIPSDGVARRQQRPAGAVENRVVDAAAAALPADNNNINAAVDDPNQHNGLPAAAGDTNIEVSAPSSSGATLEQIVTEHSAAISEHNGQSFPKFYVVVSKDDLPVTKQPFANSEVIRTIKSGTILFISSRLLGGDGRHWLKVPDGWVLEEKAGSNEAVDRFLLVPLAASSGSPTKPTKPASKDAPSQGFKERIRSTEVPFSCVLSNDSSPDVNVLRKRTSHKKAVEESSSASDRLEDIRKLQLQLQSMSRVMTDLTQSMVVCQRAITKLVNDEIEQAAVKNLELLNAQLEDVKSTSAATTATSATSASQQVDVKAET